MVFMEKQYFIVFWVVVTAATAAVFAADASVRFCNSIASTMTLCSRTLRLCSLTVTGPFGINSILTFIVFYYSENLSHNNEKVTYENRIVSFKNQNSSPNSDIVSYDTDIIYFFVNWFLMTVICCTLAVRLYLKM